MKERPEDCAEGELSRVQLLGSSEGSVPLCTLSRQTAQRNCWPSCPRAAPDWLQHRQFVVQSGSFPTDGKWEELWGLFQMEAERFTSKRSSHVALWLTEKYMFSSLILTVLSETMFTTTAVQSAAVSDQGNPVWCLPSKPTAGRDPQSCRSEIWLFTSLPLQKRDADWEG